MTISEFPDVNTFPANHVSASLITGDSRHIMPLNTECITLVIFRHVNHNLTLIYTQFKKRSCVAYVLWTDFECLNKIAECKYSYIIQQPKSQVAIFDQMPSFKKVGQTEERGEERWTYESSLLLMKADNNLYPQCFLVQFPSALIIVKLSELKRML